MGAVRFQNSTDRRIIEPGQNLDLSKRLSAFVDCLLNFCEIVSHDAKLCQMTETVSSSLLKKFAGVSATLFRVLDKQRLIDELKILRAQTGKSLRAFGAASGLGREITRKIERESRDVSLGEVIAWTEACGVDPVVWLSQFLDEPGKRIRQRDRILISSVQRALKIPSRRKIIESLVEAWTLADEQVDKNSG